MSNKNSNNIKEEILEHLNNHKEQLGEDFELIKEMIINKKDEILSNDEIAKVTEWIKKHPFLTIAFATFFGIALNKIFGRRD